MTTTAAAAVLAAIPSARAQVWVGGAQGDPNNWFNPLNWSTNAIPSPTTSATINTLPATVIEGPVPATATLVTIANTAGSTGMLTIQGGGILTNSSTSTVGGFGGAGGSGTVIVNGQGSTWNSGGTIAVGNSAGTVGTVVIENGGTAISSTVSLGAGNGSQGTMIVTGAGSSFTPAAGASQITIGNIANSTGVLTIADGGTVTSTIATVGNQAGSMGTVTVTGPGSTWTSSGGSVGQSGTGTVTIEDGGRFNSPSGLIGSVTGSMGTVTVTGAGSTWNVGNGTGTITVGGTAGGTGTLTVAEGGTVSSGPITIAAGTAAQTGTGTLNIGAVPGAAPVAPGTLTAPSVTFGNSGRGTINFNHTAADYTFAPTIMGPGTVNVLAGTTIFTAASSYTGPTNVNGGTLLVNGSIVSPTTVNNGGTLGGTGTVGAVTVASGGTLAPGPGNAPGALAVTGALDFQPGALYRVQVNSTAASTTNVTGMATLTGAHVQAVVAPGTTVRRTDTILSAAGGLGGTTFNGVTSTNPNFMGALSYTPTNVLLTLSAALGAGTPLGGNQQNVAGAINGFFNNGGTLPPGFAAVFGLTGANLTNALSQLSGETATGAERSAFELMDGFLNLMLEPHVPVSCDPRYVNDPLCRELQALGFGVQALGFAPEQQASLPDGALAYNRVLKAPPQPVPTFQPRWTAWAAGFGGGGSANGNPITGSNNVGTGIFGYGAGMDYQFSPATVFGFGLAGGGTSWDLAQGLGSGRSDAFLAGLYGVTHQGPVYLAGALAFANNWFSTNRSVLGEQLTASFQGQSYAARLEGGYSFVVPAAYNAIGITPYAAIQAQNFHTPTFSEAQPDGGFGLTYAAMNATDTRSELGSRFHELTIFNSMPVILRGRVAWAHDSVSNPALNASFESLPGTNFTVSGAPIPHDSGLASASAQLFFRPNWSLLVKFDGEFASGSQIYVGSGTLRYTW